MKKLLIHTLFFLNCFCSFAVSSGLEFDYSENTQLKRDFITISNDRLGLDCKEPENLHPMAKEIIDDYLNSNILNSVFFSDFIWMHPEHEEYLSCIICAHERPNDLIWETEFHMSCPESNNEDYQLARQKSL